MPYEDIYKGLTEEEKEKLLHSAETIKENTRKGLEHA